MENNSNKAESTSVESTDTNDSDRVEKLWAQFQMFGECEPPSSHGDEIHFNNLPPRLQQMMEKSKHWHSQTKSYDVFGLNIGVSFDNIIKARILAGDDQDELQEWKERHSQPNCAMEEWTYLGAVSEYDYLFVNTNPSSRYFGATRRVTSNCDEDEEFLPAPFDIFFEMMEEWMEQYMDLRKREPEDEWEEAMDECEMSFLQFYRTFASNRRNYSS